MPLSARIQVEVADLKIHIERYLNQQILQSQERVTVVGVSVAMDQQRPDLIYIDVRRNRE